MFIPLNLFNVNFISSYAKKKCHLKAMALGFAQSITFSSYAATFLYGGILLSQEEITSKHFFQ
jgi:hypothetical protein